MQFAIHLGLLMYCYHYALDLMPKDHVQGVDAEFKPNLVNTVSYLIQFIVQVCPSLAFGSVTFCGDRCD